MPFHKSALFLCLALHSVSSKGIPFETFGGTVLSWFLFQGYMSALVEDLISGPTPKHLVDPVQTS